MKSEEFSYKKNILSLVFESFCKFNLKSQLANPVMFIVYIGAIIVTIIGTTSIYDAAIKEGEFSYFIWSIAFFLWLTVFFANLAEAIAEGKGKAQAESLRKTRKEVMAKKLKDPKNHDNFELISACLLKKGDYVFVEAGDMIPIDAQIIEGAASIDESAITGESAAVIRENGGDCDSVIAGTKILSDWLLLRVSVNQGESFLDTMIAMVEGAKRQKTPNEIALTILLSALTLIFVLVTATLFPFSNNATALSGNSGVLSITVLIALLVCLAPTTIGGLLSAIGIAGMNRLAKANVIATSGRAVEAAGDVSVLLLDKTGTITFGNRQAANFIPAEGITEKELAEAAAMTSLADETPEGKSIVTLARSLGVQIPNVDTLDASFIHFSADTKLSGINLKNRQILKGADDSISTHLKNLGAVLSTNVEKIVHQIARSGGTPLVVADGTRIMGVIHLKDTVKPDIKNRLADLRKMGIKSVMITGDNPLTAAAIAAEAGVDDYLAQATPETKLKYIRKMQESGQLVAMVGDGTNDAPALAQADVAVAMNSGTQAAKEAANMVDLDSNPTKLIEVVEVGKQLLMTRGALTTFSIANDIAKYFAIIPTSLTSIYPELKIFNIMHLQTTESAILSAIIFNAFIIIMLVPLALKGVKYHAQSAESLLRNHIFIYGLGGIIAPFIGIKLIDLLIGLFIGKL